MARLSTVLDHLARLDGHPRATWEVYARELSETTGHLLPTRRGMGALPATAFDVANVLIANLATDSPAATPRAVDVYRGLKPRPLGSKPRTVFPALRGSSAPMTSE